MRQQAEGVGVALEVGYVGPELGAYPVLEHGAGALGEERLYGLLARVSERRVAHVVGQARRAHYRSNLRKQRVGQLRAAFHHGVGHVVAQRQPHAGHLEAVRQAVVHEDAARQGEDLRLVLQAAEGCGEDKAVVVALEFRAVLGMVPMVFFQAEPLGGEKGMPVHYISFMWNRNHVILSPQAQEPAPVLTPACARVRAYLRPGAGIWASAAEAKLRPFLYYLTAKVSLFSVKIRTFAGYFNQELRNYAEHTHRKPLEASPARVCHVPVRRPGPPRQPGPTRHAGAPATLPGAHGPVHRPARRL